MPGTTTLIVWGALSIAAVSAAPSKRSVDLEITLPNGATPRVIVREDEGAAVKLPDGKRFGFVPTIRGDEGLTVVVGTRANGHQRVGLMVGTLQRAESHTTRVAFGNT